MIYETAQDWTAAPARKVMLFGMSGLGKTHLAQMLRSAGGWFHYSVDYRIGTRYMGEHIVDNFKRVAMRDPFLASLLKSDSIYIASNLTFENLDPLSTYLGKPGDPAKGGVPFEDYIIRQRQHLEAERAAMADIPYFIDRAEDIYDYPHFVVDCSGSVCEAIDPFDPKDPIMSKLAEHVLPVWLAHDDSHEEELARRFDKAPKPMYYREKFLRECWDDYLADTGQAPDKVDPDAFIRAGYKRLLHSRTPRYRAMAENWGVTLTPDLTANIRTADDFNAAIAAVLKE
ncbi:ATPase [Paracoccaceae bacterium GXU_MW_L88]